ncbi:glutamate decarboxylase [Gymnopus androsaceus JB14]|uniref:glutamate decarboxylase n=1 Tax=Gymnopus androsaceus JB14 TaxID=1447944 RepID=A0A6A4H0T4_9AGAR|nr:glutamate decarboxylase [Gymnopus androsaceus JB14]
MSLSPHMDISQNSKADQNHNSTAVPEYESLPQFGIASTTAYQLLHDETQLDTDPTLNLTSFIHSWMPEEANRLIMENIHKSQIGSNEHSNATIIHNRCISMLASLWKAPSGKAIGTSTAGSTDAIMLGGLALKKRWQEARKAAGKEYYHPNVVFGSNAQLSLDQFSRHFDVECRLVPVKASNNYVMDPKDAIQFVDENTIGIIVILGSSFTGHFENWTNSNKPPGLDIPIHVDGATGGFIAPFIYPSLKWGFDIPRVVSINTSGHKFALVYAGLGWPASHIYAQMFNFLNLGFDGYRKIAIKDLHNARLLSRALEENYFKVLSSIHRVLPGRHEDDDPDSYEPGIPLVAFKLSDEFKDKYPHAEQGQIQVNFILYNNIVLIVTLMTPLSKSMLRKKRWIIPNLKGPDRESETEMLRVVVRGTQSEDLTQRLIADIITTTESLMQAQSTDQSSSPNIGPEN